MPDSRETDFTRFAERKPELTILSDLALGAGEAHLDSFNLRTRVGPVYDILRHPDTRTPMAIAIYGDWGSGKTSAMWWLHELLKEWNKAAKKGDVKVRPVWFYPWKYHTKDDVWRGLVAEVIIKSITVSDATVARVVTAAKQFGLFLGRSFLHALSSIKVNAAGVEVSPGQAIDEIYKDWRQTAHPEKAYLNDFEDTLRRWVKDTIGEAERMVIFIDDLDRCMPDVALQVLEALKLYLNIEKLIFVLGVDRTVIDELVKKHYEKLGLKPDKSKNYLAKMFQVQVNVDVHHEQIKGFLKEHLKDIDLWNHELSEDQRGIFFGRIMSLCGRNPREVKRLINGAMMYGSGILLGRGEQEHEGDNKLFAQALQHHFLLRILEDSYTRASLLFELRGDLFFGRWSKIVRDRSNAVKLRYIPEARGLAEAAARTDAEPSGGEIDAEARPGKDRKMPAAELPEECRHFSPLWEDTEFAHLRYLLGDEDMGELMRIEYPGAKETAALKAALSTPVSAAGPIREAVARELQKKPDELTEEDLANVMQLDLSGSEIADLTPLQVLSSLNYLDLTGTQVSDLTPLQGLSSLKYLDLERTQVSDLTSLQGLSSLERLNLDGTQVSDLTPLRGLSSLQYLDLDHTQVSDLTPLQGLNSLQSLYLTNTQVSHLTPLQGLSSLQNLTLINTHVSDLTLLQGLSSLENLDLDGTQVSDLTPLQGLRSLQGLDVRGTHVSDLTPLQGLRSLQWVVVMDTQVSDLTPLQGLSSLQDLDVRHTQVSDLTRLRGLTSLQNLDLRDTQVSGAEVDKLRQALPNCQIRP